MSKKLGYAAAGAALGAAAVLLANKGNRDKLKKKARELKDLAAKEVTELKKKAEDLGDKTKDMGDAIGKEAKDTGKKIVDATSVAKRKAKAAVKAVRTTK